MILYQLRKHLAYEIRNFSVKPNAGTQSYALTTAILARKMLDYLDVGCSGIEKLRLANGFRPDIGTKVFRRPASYELREVLNCIIHFRMLDQDDQFSHYRPTSDLVTLYSDRYRQFEEHLYPDKHIHLGRHLYIRLEDYQDMLNRLATDDLFVAHYLLPCTVERLNAVIDDDKSSTREQRKKQWDKVKDEIKDKPPQKRKKQWGKMKRDMEKEWDEMEDRKRSVSGFVANTWDILLALSHAGKVEIPQSPIDCYEKLNGGGWKKSPRFPTCREFFDGYSKSWQWARHNFITAQVEGHETHCILVNELKPKENGTLRRLAIPLDTLICFFEAVQKQID